ncbi:uncharacterized protein A1O9_01720 [Exophiala aquamarina CBS 119918]|uniref:Uncharacterized protein n=1 Tax=Exophiala aquamarina CBS 119918 TaxID=1182545 RepID=A0A072PVI5_9EURO|nr:uncharacterized protein A1O9_01720 [Exophiala aquamarina CBS 119918]KEF63742.1 hypothetical protein A1O9_01720 [Exophiala aquamarina CBS 119918]
MNGITSFQPATSISLALESTAPEEERCHRLPDSKTANQRHAATLGATGSGIEGVGEPGVGLQKEFVKIDEGVACGIITPTIDENAKQGKVEEMKGDGAGRVGKHERMPSPALNGNRKDAIGKAGPVSSNGTLVGPEGRQAEDKMTERNPFNFDCAFGYTGRFETPPAPPKTRGSLLTAMKAEITKIGVLQSGLQAYQREINSRKHHTFSIRFLVNQNTAIVVTLGQLDQIIQYVKQTQEEVEAIQDDEVVIQNKLRMEFQQAQSWVAKTRAILVHSHVFYKINFVLPGQELH